MLCALWDRIWKTHLLGPPPALEAWMAHTGVETAFFSQAPTLTWGGSE